MLVKTPETSEQILRFSSTYGEVSKLPYLAVTYEPRVGDLPRYRFERRQLTGALSANVNVGNGNLLVNEVDRQYAESNSFYALERFYNNLSTITTPTGGGWNLGRGPDVGLLFFYDGSIGFDGPSGYTVAFQKRPDGTYESPPGLNQTLTANADGTYTIADPDTDRRLLFNANGFLTAELLPGGGRVDYAYDGSGRLTSANDNLGRTTTFGYDNKGYLATMTEASGAAHGYGHDKSGNLTSYTAPNGQITRYAYDGIDLVRITDFEGDDTSFTYDTRGRVTAVIDGLASDSSAPRTTYAYSDPTAPCDPNRDLGKTVITQPDGTAVTYCYDHLLRITAQDPPPDVRPPAPDEPDDGPANPNDGTEYGCIDASTTPPASPPTAGRTHPPTRTASAHSAPSPSAPSAPRPTSPMALPTTTATLSQPATRCSTVRPSRPSRSAGCGALSRGTSSSTRTGTSTCTGTTPPGSSALSTTATSPCCPSTAAEGRSRASTPMDPLCNRNRNAMRCRRRAASTEPPSKASSEIPYWARSRSSPRGMSLTTMATSRRATSSTVQSRTLTSRAPMPSRPVGTGTTSGRYVRTPQGSSTAPSQPATSSTLGWATPPTV
jgi:YD repeat-containing protein